MVREFGIALMLPVLSCIAGTTGTGQAVNLALHKPATASSIENDEHAAPRANDGDPELAGERMMSRRAGRNGGRSIWKSRRICPVARFAGLFAAETIASELKAPPTAKVGACQRSDKYHGQIADSESKI